MNLNRHYTDLKIIDFAHLPELQPYLSDPPAMYVGAPGKCGYLDLVFELNADGRSVLRDLNRRAPLIVQQELYFDRYDKNMPCVYILSSGGPNVDGDRYAQNITVRAGAQAHIATGAATKIACMEHNYSSMSQLLTLEENAYLEVLPEPVIPCRNARYVSDTTLIVHPTATAIYAEIYTPGRTHYSPDSKSGLRAAKGGEIFAYNLLSLTTRGVRPNDNQSNNKPLFTEKMVIRPDDFNVRTLGSMNGYLTFATVTVMTPKVHADAIYNATQVYMDKHTAIGISHLPGSAGIIYKVLAQKTEHAKALVRAFASTVRAQVKGIPLPADFPWR